MFRVEPYTSQPVKYSCHDYIIPLSSAATCNYQSIELYNAYQMLIKYGGC